MSKKTLYFDYAAATPADKAVVRAMGLFWDKVFFNPSAIYSGGREAKANLAVFKQNIAGCIGTKPAEIVFTSGGTEANNLAIKGIMDLHSGAKMVTSLVEHESVLMPASGYPCKTVPVDNQGQVDIAELEKVIDDQTVLVSIQYANNEIGTIQDLKQIGELVADIRQRRIKNKNKLGIFLHSDACQAPNYLDINPRRLGVDLMSINGGKIYGPKASGLLFVKAGVTLKPLIDGGGQEFGIRSGTESLPVAAGLSEAIKIASLSRRTESQRVDKLASQFIKSILSAIPNAKLNSPQKNRLPNIVNFSFEGYDNERLIHRLDMYGLACSAGSACSASSEKPSHVLSAIGLKPSSIRSSLRFSMGRPTKESDIKKAVEILVKSLNEEQ